MNANDLIAFEDEVASLFNSAKIKALFICIQTMKIT